MKSSISLLVVVFVTYSSFANSDEIVGGWLDFQLLMTKKEAKPIINSICLDVEDYNTYLKGFSCSVDKGFFKNIEIDISLFGKPSFFDSNSQIVSISIGTDFDDSLFNSLKNHLISGWNIEHPYKCNASGQKCGISFNNNRIQLIHNQISSGGVSISGMNLNIKSYDGMPPIWD